MTIYFWSNQPLNTVIEIIIFIRFDVFKKSIKIYNDALHENHFKETLKFVIPATKNNGENQKSNWKRNLIWFNSKNVKTKTFLQLLSKHFPKEDKIHKIFNKTTLKMSYSCMNNIS